MSGCHWIFNEHNTQCGTSCGGGYGSLGHVFLSPDARRNIYVARHVLCATCILKFERCANMRGQRFTLEIEGCRRSHIAATTEGQSANPCRFQWSAGSYVIFSFFNSKGLHGAVMSLDLQRAAHSVEHRATATMKHCTMFSCLVTCGLTSTGTNCGWPNRAEHQIGIRSAEGELTSTVSDTHRDLLDHRRIGHILGKVDPQVARENHFCNTRGTLRSRMFSGRHRERLHWMELLNAE